jgi:hypothetical protein
LAVCRLEQLVKVTTSFTDTLLSLALKQAPISAVLHDEIIDAQKSTAKFLNLFFIV